MSIQAQSADGVVHEFPDGTPDTVIDGAMRSYVSGGQPAAPRAKASPYAGKPKGAERDAYGGAFNLFRSIPLMDEGAAAIDSGYRLLSGQAHSVPEAWKQSRDTQNLYADDFEKRRPIAATAIKTAGAVGSALVPAGQGANLFAEGGRVLNAARGATLAAGNAYIYGATDKGTLAERARAGAQAASDPATLALGAGFGAAAGGVAPKPNAAPTRAELTTQRKAAYADVKASGQTYSNDQFGEMVGAIKRDLAAADFDPDFQPTVATMVRKLEEKAATGYAPTLQEMDDLRQFIRKNVAGAGDKNVRRLGTRMIGSLDGFLDAAGGDEALQTARNLYSREQKVKAVEIEVEKARRQAAKTGSGGNVDNIIRQRMDRLLETTPNLTGEERAALEGVVYGSGGQNALRIYGKTSPLVGGLPAMLNTLAAVPSGGVSLIAHSIPSSVAKVAADRITQGKVRDLIQLMAAGGTREQLLTIQQEAAAIPGPAGDALRRMAAARLSAAAGAQGGVRSTASAPNLFAQP